MSSSSGGGGAGAGGDGGTGGGETRCRGRLGAKAHRLPRAETRAQDAYYVRGRRRRRRRRQHFAKCSQAALGGNRRLPDGRGKRDEQAEHRGGRSGRAARLAPLGRLAPRRFRTRAAGPGCFGGRVLGRGPLVDAPPQLQHTGHTDVSLTRNRGNSVCAGGRGESGVCTSCRTATQTGSRPAQQEPSSMATMLRTARRMPTPRPTPPAMKQMQLAAMSSPAQGLAASGRKVPS